MTVPAISQAFGAAAITAARQPRQRPDADPCVLCIYRRTGKFVYWLAACRLPSASCPGCQRRGPAGGQVVLPDGRPGAWPTRTMPTAHRLPDPAAQPTDPGRWADRPVRRDRIRHRRRPPADPVRAEAGPRAPGAGRGGGARPERAHHRSHRLTLNRPAGIKVPGRPGHVSLPVTGPGSRFLAGGCQLMTGIPVGGIPAQVIPGQLLVFRAGIRRLP
jgi:hypothetical protein